MSLDLTVQTAIRARLISDDVVLALVPATSILDRNSLPAPDPSIIIGEVQEVDPGTSLSRNRTRIYHTIHVWKVEPSREGVKRIIAAVRAALRSGRLDLTPDFHCADLRVSSSRTMSDPDGKTSHGVMVVDVLVQDLSA